MTGARTESLHRALIILDGLGDRPHPETSGLSPVEAAKTPNLDHLLADGRRGLVMLIGPGTAPESDAGVLALLGYDPEKDSPGRGVLEALGVEVPLEPGDVALRMNFATLAPDGTIADSRVGRGLSTSESTALARTLTEANLLAPEGIRAELRATVGHRGVLWLHPIHGGGLSPEVSNADPFYERVGGLGRARTPTNPRVLLVAPLDDRLASVRTADAVNRFLERARSPLAAHPVNQRRAQEGRPLANGILLRNAGTLPAPPPEPFLEKYGMSGAAVTEMPVERGIARQLGLDDLYVGPMGADRDAALRERARVTREALARQPFVYVHLKGPDEPGHDGKAVAKKEIIEALDRSFFGPFLDGIDWANTRIAVTADHATPCILRAHSDDPVPLVMAGFGPEPTARTGRGDGKFSERVCADGSLGVQPARLLLARLLASGSSPTP
ncbi:MAG: alkaline phosphatase family protein [Thermoplasmata archaeon]|nr:alkaline phosphatase family protein [Thermoplasmata archaeon]